MTHRLVPFALVLGVLALGGALGCAGARARAAVDAEAARDRTCESADHWRAELRAISRADVLDVQPSYLVDTCSGVAKVTGVTIVVRVGHAADGPISSHLERLERCGDARVYARADDPIELTGAGVTIPDGWLDVRVARERRGLAIALGAESVAKNLALFRRTESLRPTMRGAQSR